MIRIVSCAMAQRICIPQKQTATDTKIRERLRNLIANVRSHIKKKSVPDICVDDLRFVYIVRFSVRVHYCHRY